jgi:ribosome-associated protein
MADHVPVTDAVRIPAWAWSWEAVRAGGPGGQNVNKVASKVQLRITPQAIEGLHPAALERLLARIRNRLDAEGRWLIICDATRDQSRNLEEAFAKAVALIQEILVPPKVRTATRPTRGSQVRRVEAKRRTSDKKRGRGGDWD